MQLARTLQLLEFRPIVAEHHREAFDRTQTPGAAIAGGEFPASQGRESDERIGLVDDLRRRERCSNRRIVGAGCDVEGDQSRWR